MHVPPGRTLSKNDWPKNPETNPITTKPKTASHVARGRAVLLGFLTLLLSTQVPSSNKVSCFVSMCVPLDNSFKSVRQEPTFGPWKGSPFWQQYRWWGRAKIPPQHQFSGYQQNGLQINSILMLSAWRQHQIHKLRAQSSSTLSPCLTSDASH